MRLTITRVLAVTAALLSANNILAAQQVTIPEGTVIELRMDSGLNSETSQVNDAFKASVVRSVLIDGRIAVPENSTVNGRVTMVQPAERSSRSGVIGVEFNQLSINGKAYSIEGTLTSLHADERKQIIDEQSRVTGKSSTPRNILFIGGGAGVGAAIGAIAGGGKGAGIGALTGGGIGALGALLSRGSEADVPLGSEVAMQLVRAVDVNAPRDLRQTTDNARTLYTTANMVRGAQTALRQRKYYDGATNGRLDDATRRSIAHYQIDNNQPATGDLDQATASSLGLVRTGVDSRSNGEATARQRAVDINRKAATLLDNYEKRLGVRVSDIRSKPLSEQDLDLLLQVDAFVKAAVWYEQSARVGTSLGTPFDNFGRILLRSARRVEQDMQTASQDRRFEDAWSSIQVNLRDINLDESFSVQ
jgi:Putative peptidoglycan binding domain